MIIIDKLCYSSKLRYKSPYLKASLAVSLLLLTVIAKSLSLALLILIFMSALVIVKGGIKLGQYCRFLAVPLAFLVLSSLAIAVNLAPEPLSAWSISLGNLGYLTASYNGLLLVSQLILTALSAISCLYFLTLTTPLPDILLVLKRIHCPYLIIELMMLIYRFIFILLEMAYQLRLAQICRLGNRNKRTSWKALGQLMAVLLVKSMQKANAVFEAMESRCYSGVIAVYEESCPASRREIILVALVMVIFLALALTCIYTKI